MRCGFLVLSVLIYLCTNHGIRQGRSDLHSRHALGTDGRPADYGRCAHGNSPACHPQDSIDPRDSLFGRGTRPHHLDHLCHAILVTAADRLEKRLQELLFGLALPRAGNSVLGRLWDGTLARSICQSSLGGGCRWEMRAGIGVGEGLARWWWWDVGCARVWLCRWQLSSAYVWPPLMMR